MYVGGRKPLYYPQMHKTNSGKTWGMLKAVGKMGDATEKGKKGGEESVPRWLLRRKPNQIQVIFKGHSNISIF